MRINELIVESQQIDEISLAGIGKGIGKAANVAGKAVGGAVGGTVAAAKQFGQGVKQGYQGAKTTVGGGQTAPQQTATDPVSGKTPEEAMKDPRYTSDPAFKAEVDKAASFGTAPTELPAGGKGTGQNFDPQTGKPISQYGQQQQTAQQQPAPAANTTQLKAPPVAPGGLDGIKKAYSILDPNEKEQLKKDLEVIDDQDRLASGTNESRRVGMKSNFLGIDL